MSPLLQVEPPHRTIARFEPVIGPHRYQRLVDNGTTFARMLGERTIWNINSTAVGGGVAEMLQALVGYTRGSQLPVRWTVISGDPPFFATTKRLHNQMHGDRGGGPFTAEDNAHYARVLATNARALLDLVRPGDIVMLHDPQTAGLTDSLVSAGAHVIWRCHIGVDWTNEATESAWSFIEPRVRSAHRLVFSREQYVPAWAPRDLVSVIPPSIDPFSPKNQQLDESTIHAILSTIGVIDAPKSTRPGQFIRYDGTPATVSRPAEVTCDALPRWEDPVVLQVSRWDRLKDMGGVMTAFADHVASAGNAHLMLVGPAVSDVADDPEGAVVYQECVRQWQALPAAARAKICLVTLPLDDIEENAAMVNALQRHATIISQKSVAEGFGLTVSEGMWKGRPVVGSAVGGILDQVSDGTGVLLPDPRDLSAFGAALCRLLDDPDKTEQLGLAAQAQVKEHFVGDVHLLRYARLFTELIARDGR